MLIFDEATSNLDQSTAGHFCAAVNQLKGNATMLFITHAILKNLQVDQVVRLAPDAPERAKEAALQDVVKAVT